MSHHLTPEAKHSPALTGLADFLYPEPAPRRVGAILAWWERRRPAYNLMVGTAGLVTFLVAPLFFWLPPGGTPGEWIPWQVPLVTGLAANFFYFLGPAVEVAAWKLFGRGVLPLGPSLYRMGLTFSVGLVLFPLVLFPVLWIVRLVAMGVFGAG